MTEVANQEVWRAIFAEGHPQLKAFQRFHSWLPSPPRCRLCYAPFGGAGSLLMKLKGKTPCARNPHYCNACDAFIQAFPGGAEVELAVVFVDVRNSVGLAERLGATAFSQVMSRFYAATSETLTDADGFVLDFIGDSVGAIFPPGFCGPDYARKAMRAAERIVHGRKPRLPDGSELAMGVGVHSGPVFIGTVSGAGGENTGCAALGDNVNITSRLCGAALAGEALISESCWSSAGCQSHVVETRELELKGKTVPIVARAVSARTPSLQFVNNPSQAAH